MVSDCQPILGNQGPNFALSLVVQIQRLLNVLASCIRRGPGEILNRKQ